MSFVCYVTIRIQIGFDGKDKQLSENIKEKRGRISKTLIEILSNFAEKLYFCNTKSKHSLMSGDNLHNQNLNLS